MQVRQNRTDPQRAIPFTHSPCPIVEKELKPPPVHSDTMVTGTLHRIRASTHAPMKRCWWIVLAPALSAWLGGRLLCPSLWSASSEVPITSVAQFWSVPTTDFARGLPVQLEGVVLYEDPEWHLFFFQDDTGVSYFTPPDDLGGCKAGDRVRITGTTALVGTDRRITGMQVEVLGTASLGAAPTLPLHEFTNASPQALRVSLLGVVRAVEPLDGNRARLILDIGAGRLQVFVRRAAPEQLRPLLYDVVRVVGLRVPARQTSPERLPVELLAKDLEDVQLLRATPDDPFQAPLTTVANLLASANVQPPLSLHRIRGRAHDHVVGRSFMLDDGTGRIEVYSPQTLVLTNGSPVEVAGFPTRVGTNRLVLDEAVFRYTVPGWAGDAAVTNRLFDSIPDIRALTPEQAAVRSPVSLEAAVTYHDPNWGVLFVQQGDSGIYVQCAQPPPPLRPGDWVRIEGVTGPGGYAPIIEQAKVTLLGQGEPPPPVPARESVLFSGLLDSVWTEVRAQVHTARKVGPNLELELRTPRGGIQAWLQGWGDRPVPEEWIGLPVKVQGVVGSRFNALRQFTGVTLHIPGESFLEFLEPVPDDPWDRPVTPIRDLLTSRTTAQDLPRTKIRAVVTHVQTNGWTAVEDATGGLWLHLPDSGLEPGQEVEILGFATTRGAFPTLEHAVVRVVGRMPLPRPVRATAAALFTPELEGRRVQVEGTLVENQADLTRPYLLLDESGSLLHVYLPADGSARRVRHWKPGSRVAVTGTCQLQADEWGRLRAVRLLTTSPADLRLLAGPPVITRRHLAWIGAGTGLAALLALLWSFTLRRKVQAQTRLLEEQFKRELDLKQRYEDLFENAGDAVLFLDPEGRLSAVNRAAENVLGAARDQLRGRLLTDLLHPEDRPKALEALKTIREGGSCAPFETRLLPRNRKEPVLELHLQPVKRDGQLIGLECIGRDLSERRQLEVQLRQMQRLESVGQMAAGVAHDYNNILTVILGHTGMLLHEETLPTQFRDSIKEIQDAAARAANLTRQLLAFSRKQVMKAQPTNLNEVVSDMAKMLRRLLGEHIELVLQLDPSLSPIHADVAMLEQVIVNLAVNARDAMPDGGTLTVRTETVEVTREQMEHWPDAIPGRHVRLTVTDTGIGMDAETLQHIFEPFFTTKPFGKGSGLGLSTVYGIVKQHNGWIEVESQPGQGSSFRVYFPALKAPARMAATLGDPAGRAPRGKETILAVEDEPALRLMLANGLRRLGYQVFAAANGQEALQIWEKHRDQIDLVITDMVMPGGMNGTDLVNRLRADRPRLRVIFSSGYSQELFGADLNQLPGTFLPKPYTPTKLATAVRACLDAPPPPDAPTARAETATV